jgi:hypothetical protein
MPIAAPRAGADLVLRVAEIGSVLTITDQRSHGDQSQEILGVIQFQAAFAQRVIDGVQFVVGGLQLAVGLDDLVEQLVEQRAGRGDVVNTTDTASKTRLADVRAYFRDQPTPTPSCLSRSECCPTNGTARKRSPNQTRSRHRDRHPRARLAAPDCDPGPRR